MTELWYQNPKVLLDNMDHFFPNKSLNRNQKINSLARFAIYYSILIVIFNQDTKWFSISIIILLISAFLGKSENFTISDKKINNQLCQGPTKDNPFMNYTMGDLLEDKDRSHACKYDDTKVAMRNNFRSHLHSDSNDLWGQYISDRNFYTMPVTDIVNDQTGFALWCFGNSGDCKTSGKNCLKIQDHAFGPGRLSTVD